MSPNPILQITSALKRNNTSSRKAKATASRNQSRQSEGRDVKAQHILGISQADFSVARNQSITSSSSRGEHPTNFSDATTDLGYSLPSNGQAPQIPELHLKASSVLLHENFILGDSDSVKSIPLQNQKSSSTLNSHYEASFAPLSISQQTSDSSRRDFALRKGSPMVITTTTPEMDSLRQFKLLRTSKSTGDQLRSTKAQRSSTKAAPTYGSSIKQRPISGHDSFTSIKSIQAADTQSFQVTRLVARGTTGVSSQKTIKTKKSLSEPLDPTCVKVNVRRPKVGARHWFDGHEGDSSDEEFVDEPDLKEPFASSLNLAFENGQIMANPPRTSFDEKSYFEHEDITPRIPSMSNFARRQDQSPNTATLRAKASQSSTVKHTSSTKRRLDPFAGTDLNSTSVMNFSSSDDEEEEPKTPQQPYAVLPRPKIRDSVASAFSDDVPVEFGTAKAISTQASSRGQQLSQVKKLSVVSRSSKVTPLKMPIPKRGSSLMLSYLNMQAEQEEGPDEIIESFPATPTESRRLSVVVGSDVDSIESRRLMSVTRQEETLLAAMRMKRANMGQTTTQDKRREALRNLEKNRSSPGSQVNRTTYNDRSSSSDNQSIEHNFQLYQGGFTGLIDEEDSSSPSRTSGTTFQTHTTRQTRNFSRNALRISADDSQRNGGNNTRLSMSSDHTSISPSLLSATTTDRRLSRDTYMSASSRSHNGHTRNNTVTSHIVALDNLDQVPKRDEIQSQEFIDWPYNGWQKRATLGVAH